MKLVFIFCAAFLGFYTSTWHTDLAEARQIARKENKHILLNFSGSDWCGPCIRMRKEIFDSEPFSKMADSGLVLVNADFPRMRKNQLPARQQESNNALADKYNSKGIFPLTLLLDADGKILGEWEGFPNMGPEEFSHALRSIIDKDR